MFFFFNDTATTEIYTLSLHDALPICHAAGVLHRPGVELRHEELVVLVERVRVVEDPVVEVEPGLGDREDLVRVEVLGQRDRKSTRLNSSHANISYAVFCLKKKKIEA